ncbi:lysophospholipase L1-like esterase [Fontibacillus phaseoli]|uniref:Lysophospholipase L1-like esterase n=1 Tax=Fontibacillus phaseoli TaxID=1416533 RepID=A0A369BSI7_9BACL|nr:rhamnogalacturonan acetylesterase [Fontibacillus phaseoli]RCX22564.1 lysophospholipase L1-like esterase [Fontibacillus phaseoli]
MTSTLFIAGDSTAAIKGASEKPMTGWGEYLQGYFRSSFTVDNRAVNGRSTKSFLTERRLTAIEKEFQAGDYLFIQFGHNDGKLEDPLRYAAPNPEYRENLVRFIESARRNGGTPVLLTSVSRRRFLEGGIPDPLAVGEYPEVMRQVADDTGTALLDIFAASQQLYRALGVDGTRHLFMHLPKQAHPNYPDDISDDTHFSDVGARHIASLVAQAIHQSHALPELKRHLKGTAESAFPGKGA